MFDKSQTLQMNSLQKISLYKKKKEKSEKKYKNTKVKGR